MFNIRWKRFVSIWFYDHQLLLPGSVEVLARFDFGMCRGGRSRAVSVKSVDGQCARSVIGKGENDCRTKMRAGISPKSSCIGVSWSISGGVMLTRCYFWEFEFNRQLFGVKLDNCNHIYP